MRLESETRTEMLVPGHIMGTLTSNELIHQAHGDLILSQNGTQLIYHAVWGHCERDRERERPCVRRMKG